MPIATAASLPSVSPTMRQLRLHEERLKEDEARMVAALHDMRRQLLHCQQLQQAEDWQQLREEAKEATAWQQGRRTRVGLFVPSLWKNQQSEERKEQEETQPAAASLHKRQQRREESVSAATAQQQRRVERPAGPAGKEGRGGAASVPAAAPPSLQSAFAARLPHLIVQQQQRQRQWARLREDRQQRLGEASADCRQMTAGKGKQGMTLKQREAGTARRRRPSRPMLADECSGRRRTARPVQPCGVLAAAESQRRERLRARAAHRQ